MSNPYDTAKPRKASVLGPTLKFKGELTADEDLMIQGHVNGEIRLPKNKVTIGQSGRVEADVYGKSIRVEGQVKGNLYGEQDVVVLATKAHEIASVAPRAGACSSSSARSRRSISTTRAIAASTLAWRPASPDTASASARSAASSSA